jgi:hypothetical protein
MDQNFPHVETLEVEVAGGAVASYKITKTGEAEYEYTCTTLRNEQHERTETKKIQIRDDIDWDDARRSLNRSQALELLVVLFKVEGVTGRLGAFLGDLLKELAGLVSWNSKEVGDAISQYFHMDSAELEDSLRAFLDLPQVTTVSKLISSRSLIGTSPHRKPGRSKM